MSFESNQQFLVGPHSYNRSKMSSQRVSIGGQNLKGVWIPCLFPAYIPQWPILDTWCHLIVEIASVWWQTGSIACCMCFLVFQRVESLNKRPHPKGESLDLMKELVFSHPCRSLVDRMPDPRAGTYPCRRHKWSRTDGAYCLSSHLSRSYMWTRDGIQASGSAEWQWIANGFPWVDWLHLVLSKSKSIGCQYSSIARTFLSNR